MLTKTPPVTATEPRTFDVTTDYKQFQPLHGNRHLNKAHLNQLEKSIQTNNLLAVNPIIVNEKMEIIDGQHRYEVARRNKFPLYYVVIPNSTMTEVHLLNRNNREWQLKDFLESYIELGYSDYRLVKEAAENLSIPISFAVALLMGRAGRDHTSLDMFRAGDFVATHPEAIQRFGPFLTALRAHTTKAVGRHREFVQAVITLSKKVDPDEFLKKLKQVEPIFEAHRITTEYLRDFELVWNTGRTHTERLF